MIPRRDFLKTGGALVIGFSLRGTSPAQVPGRGAPAGPDMRQIDTWLAIHADNTASVSIGYAELGQGNSTALLQIAAEELDLDMAQLKSVGLETNRTPNQGGTYSSASIARGGPQVRSAAAEARQALLRMASERLNTPVERLSVAKGVVSGDAQRSVSYGELIGDKRFNLAFTGNAPVKNSASYRVVAAGVPRRDTPAKVTGTHTYMQHLRVPNMLHGRVVRPRGQAAYGAGAKVVSVDEQSIRGISAKVIRRADFIGIVAEKEWDAVRAAQQLKVAWDIKPTLPGSDKLHDAMRAAKTADNVALERGDVATAIASAPHVATGRYHGPYQMHAPFAPNCALADVQTDGAVVMCSSQDIYTVRGALARVLGIEANKVRVQYHEGSGTYGHSCYDDVTLAAAILSKESGRPVRVQFMRWDEHGWDTYGPPHVGEVRVAANAEGKLVAYDYQGWQHSWSNTETSDQLAGATPADRPGFGAQGINPRTLGGMYTVPNIRLVNHHVPALEYLRGAWLRSPLDLAMAFAAEQAIDELAYKLSLDPYEFRKRNIADERWEGVLDGAAKAAKWTSRRAAANVSRANVVAGRGIGLGTHLQSWGGAVAEIEINRQTGKVRIVHLYGAMDAGLAVNPAIVEAQIMGQLVQTASRMLYEEVKFSQTAVTSLDWSSYPVLRFEECPEVTPVVVQRVDKPSSGAGEEVMAAAAAAIANAFFDATGKRMTEFPFTPERVLRALRA